MLKVVATVTLGVLVIAGASAGSQKPEPQPIADPDAYAVYATLLPREWTIRVAGASRLVVQREAGTYRDCLPSGPPMKAEWAEVLANYEAENARVRHLLPDRPLGYPYVLVPREEIMAIFERRSPDPEKPDEAPLRHRTPAHIQGPWKTFYERYPDSGGYLVFSAVGFNEGKTRALVYIGHHCGNLCGGGTHHFLQKVDDRWREIRPKDVTMCMWMS
jgi:hypothetical protein